MSGLIRNWKRKRLRKRPVPDSWPAILNRHLPFFRHLPQEEKESFFEKLKIFAWEKHFIGAGGLVITEEIRVVISAAAVRLVQHLDLTPYDRLTEIVVYPHHYRHPENDEIMLGEAHQWGTVVLSWPAVLHGLEHPCDGHDTALHEFAHVLDRDTGHFDGTPRLRASEHYRAWGEVMSRHYGSLRRGSRRQLMVLRGYGAKNEAEFFAVATESFFERPVQMKQLTPDLYHELKQFYGFDPVSDPTCGLSA